MASVRHLQYSKISIFVTWRTCLSMVLLICTKYRVNRTITRGDIAKRRFSVWRLSAILNFINFYKSACGRSWNQYVSLHTKFHQNRVIPGWDITIKPFSKWRSSATLNFQNLVFWSYDLCLNVILLLRIKYRVNRTINRGDIAERRFSIWRPSAILDLLWRRHIASENTISSSWHCVKFSSPLV